METRIIRNRLAFGRPYRVQLGTWVAVYFRSSDRSPSKRFAVAYEEDCQTRADAIRRAAELGASK